MKTETPLCIWLLALLILSLSSTTIQPRTIQHGNTFLQAFQDPFGQFQGSGVPVGISWNGQGQRIVNPSFETGSLSPWIQSQFNTAGGSTATVTTPGYSGTKSAQLTLLSGNITFNSYLY